MAFKWVLWAAADREGRMGLTGAGAEMRMCD